MTIKKWQAKAPNSGPEGWDGSPKSDSMEEEILESRAEGQKWQNLQLLDAGKVRHALQHVQLASRLLVDAHQKQPGMCMGFYDNALIHSDTAIFFLEAALLPLNTTTKNASHVPQTR